MLSGWGMPITRQLYRTPGGHTVLRTVTSGQIQEDEAIEMMRTLQKGGEHHGRALLSFTEPDADISAAARKAFTESRRMDEEIASAIVITSTSMRVMLNFMLRVAGGGAGQKMRTFNDEATAVKWLDDHLDALAAGKKP